MKVIYLACLLCAVINAQSQSNNSTKKISVHPSISIGIAEGKSRSAALLNTGLGLRFKTIQAGVGIGIDEYYLRSIPIYFEARKYISSRKSTPFAYGSVGTNLPWVTTQQGVSYTGRLYYDLGIGYQFPIAFKYSLFFSAGYSYKDMSNEQSYPLYCITWPCPEQRQYFQYELRRLSLKAGVNF